MTDVGVTRRSTLSPLKRLKIFEEHKGMCALCGLRIISGQKWIVEHMIPLAMGGADTADNMRPVHKPCADAKTKDDLPMIAKTKRKKAKALGLYSSKTPMPGGRSSKWKKTFRHGWVLREKEDDE